MGVSTAGLLCLGTLVVLVSSGLAGHSCTTEEMRNKEELQKLAFASNAFGLGLHQALSFGSSKNLVFSPFSLSCIFGMLLYGARNRTAKDLRLMLNYYDTPDDLVHHTFHRFLTEVLPSNKVRPPYVLHVANALFFDRTLDVLPEYRTEVQRLYQAAVRDVDFRGDTQGVVNEINQWVKDQTRGKIKKLVDDLRPDTAMVLLNAVYFKGTWKTQFDKKRTYEESFFNGGNENDVSKVNMMHIKGRFRYAASYGVQVLELPYKGDALSMLIMLPNKYKGLSHFEKKGLTLTKFMELYDLLYDTKVVLSLPKFKIRSGADMTNVFFDIGSGDLFVPGAADLSGLTLDRNRTIVNNVMHKAAIEVNEEGSEAAALSSIITTRMGDETVPVFRADHPFLFFIVEQGKGSTMILFMGRVNRF